MLLQLQPIGGDFCAPSYYENYVRQGKKLGVGPVAIGYLVLSSLFTQACKVLCLERLLKVQFGRLFWKLDFQM